MAASGRRSGRPTLEEVAARAGVGRGTVSRVINGSPQVSEETRAAVERAVAAADFTEEGGRRAMRELLERNPGLDAVFAASDVMAAGARQVLRETGRRVPEDVALVGFDDSPIARHMDPPLTSVRQPTEEMGRVMARVLLEEIAKRTPEPRHLMLATELVVRASS